MTSQRTPTDAETIRQAIESRLCDVHTCLPGTIEKYDAATQKADVKPLIRRLQLAEDGVIDESLPVITDVPVRFPRAGGLTITLPVKKGDHCMIHFAEQSIDNFQAGQGTEVSPETFYRFDLTDAVAVMGWNPDSKAMPATDLVSMFLGNPEASIIQFLALAQKTLDNFDRLKSELDAFKSAFDGHSHILTIAAAAGAGGTGTAAPPASGFPSPASPTSVASADVKAS